MKEWNLNGTWNCSLDGETRFEVMVPGCFDTYTENKNIGDPVVFTKNFLVNKELEFYQLRFGGVSYYCDIYLNNILVGSHEGMWDRFFVDVTDYLQEGENELRLSVIKPGYQENDTYPLREVLSGFIPDVLCTFGGMWDDVALEEADEFFTLHHCGKGSRAGKTAISTSIDIKKQGKYQIWGCIKTADGDIVAELEKKEVDLGLGIQDVSFEHQLENPKLWDLQNPNLYSYEICIQGEKQKQTLHKKYGYRDIETKGTKILLNGKPIYIRGILHWGYYDEEIIPNPSKETIYSEIRKCKENGFNMIKHCLYIPRDAYFEAADELGILLWVELPVWLPEPTVELEPRIRREYPRILKQIDGYASIVIVSLGCELDNKVSADILEEMYHYVKSQKNVLVRDNSGSGECYGGLSVDFADFFDYHFYADLQNMEQLLETFTPAWRNYRPWIFGEFCDSDTMRDLAVLRKSRGVEKLWWENQDISTNPICGLKPDFFAGEHDERMEKSGIHKDYELIKKLSEDHSMVHRKTTLEQTRSFPAITGYNITCIRDVPIATSGIFNDDMKEKFSQKEFAAINADVMLVPAWDLTRIWINADRVMNRERYNFFGGDTYGLHLLLSNYGGCDLKEFELNWVVRCKTNIILSGRENISIIIENGEIKELYYLHFELPQTECAETYELVVTVNYGEKQIENKWPIFVYSENNDKNKKFLYYDPSNVFTTLEKIYPACVELSGEEEITQEQVIVTSRLTSKIKEYLKKGGKVFYLQRGKGSLPIKPVAFWREGMIRTYEHPVLEGCERQIWLDDLRYFSVGTDTALDTFELEKGGFTLISPIIRRYDCREWKMSEYMAEYQYGEGTMIATTLRLEGGMGKQPMFLENNKLGRYLTENILKYFTIR